MRCLSIPCRVSAALLLTLLVGPLAWAEDLPQYSIRNDNPAKPARVEVDDLDLVFPLSQLPAPPSSRRAGAWQQNGAPSEPGLFTIDGERPPKPLTGQWAERSIWQTDYTDTWGTHPATPVPSRTPRLGLRLHDADVIPVAGEEAIDCPAKCAGAKCKTCSQCKSCSKCEACKCEACICERCKCEKSDTCKCEGCSGKACHGSCKESTPEQGETAKVILELMETLGRSVLDGTVFQNSGQAEQEWLKELSADGQVSPREALIQYIRRLEAQKEQSSPQMEEVAEVVELDFDFVSHPLQIKSPCSCPENCTRCSGECLECPAECAECRDCPGCPGLECAGLECAGLAPSLGDCPASEIAVLREMSAHLEMAAQELERREIYHRADQLRDVAGQLRQDARRTSLAKAPRKHKAIEWHVQPPRDVQVQLNELREELARTRAELELANKKSAASR